MHFCRNYHYSISKSFSFRNIENWLNFYFWNSFFESFFLNRLLQWVLSLSKIAKLFSNYFIIRQNSKISIKSADISAKLQNLDGNWRNIDFDKFWCPTNIKAFGNLFKKEEKIMCFLFLCTIKLPKYFFIYIFHQWKKELPGKD